MAAPAPPPAPPPVATPVAAPVKSPAPPRMARPVSKNDSPWLMIGLGIFLGILLYQLIIGPFILGRKTIFGNMFFRETIIRTTYKADIIEPILDKPENDRTDEERTKAGNTMRLFINNEDVTDEYCDSYQEGGFSKTACDYCAGNNC